MDEKKIKNLHPNNRFALILKTFLILFFEEKMFTIEDAKKSKSLISNKYI